MSSRSSGGRRTVLTGSQRELIPVESFDDVPDFETEAEEHEFWSTHCFGEGILKDMKPVPLEGDNWLPPARNETVVRRAGRASRRGDRA
jgi:hypothetical protein